MLYCFIITVLMLNKVALCSAKTRIAIIGGGISGTSTAYWLRELLGDSVDLVLFEGGNIGGRLSTIKVDGLLFETGGSIIHKKNKYASSFADKFGLKKKMALSNEVLGLFDGNGFIFVGSKIKYWDMIKLLWRYRFDLFKLETYTHDLLSRFSRVYDLQHEMKSYVRVSDLMAAIDPVFLKYMKVSTKDGFEKDGFSSRVVNELIQSTLKCNYGQTTAVNQFVGSVSVSTDSNDLFSIEGGNKLLPLNLLDASGAKVVPSFVKKVIATSSKPAKYLVTNEDNMNEDNFDIVVISTPLTNDSSRSNVISFQGFPENISVPGKYWTTVCTIVKGDINPQYFGYATSTEVPDFIISVKDESLFNSISKIKPVTYLPDSDNLDVWKIFSRTVLTGEKLGSIFNRVEFLQHIDWLAYPDYVSMAEDYNFILSDDLFYTNAMEWSASAIETGIIGARNVALLINQKLRGNATIEESSLLHNEL